MKKRYLILAGILAAGMLAAGCGKKNSVAPEQKVEATATPTVTEAAKTDVVEMQTSADETANIKNVMGTKSETTTSIVFTNKNSTISAIYVRPTRDDGDDSDETWGSDLVNGKFTLASNDKAVYYMEKSQKDDNGDTATSFDVRITFSDEDQNECFFRQLPLLTISQLSLCMDGEGEDGIPYATYLASGSTKEVSTLKDVKARLGIEDESDSTDSSDSTVVTPTPKNSDDNGGSTDSSSSGISDSTSTPDHPTSAPASSDSSDAPDPTEAPSGEDDPASVAAGYIGRPMSELENACGSPNGSDYEDEPESGKTGYYYYDTFTVSTTFDDDGNEVVSGVW
jgi:cytoskeletal protein RodZ